MLWNVITDFGDSAAMLPASGLLLLWLIASRQVRAALIWAGLFGAQAVLVAATKIAFLGWGVGWPALDFTGISGHSALASSVIPIGCHLAARGARPPIGPAATVAGFAGGLLVGISRVALAQHSPSEVAAGCALGFCVALAFLHLTRGDRPGVLLPAPALAGMLAVMALLIHGAHAPSQRLMTHIALQLSGHSAPYVRRHPGRPWVGAGFDDISASRSEALVKAGAAMIGSAHVIGRQSAS